MRTKGNRGGRKFQNFFKRIWSKLLTNYFASMPRNEIYFGPPEIRLKLINL